MPLLLMFVKLLLLIPIVSLKVNILSNIYLCRQNAIFLILLPGLITLFHTDCTRLYQHISRASIPQPMIKVCQKVPDQTRIKFLYSSQNLELFLGTCVGLHTLDCRKRGHVFYVIMDPSSRSGGGGREGGIVEEERHACLLPACPSWPQVRCSRPPNHQHQPCFLGKFFQLLSDATIL